VTVEVPFQRGDVEWLTDRTRHGEGMGEVERIRCHPDCGEHKLGCSSCCRTEATASLGRGPVLLDIAVEIRDSRIGELIYYREVLFAPLILAICTLTPHMTIFPMKIHTPHVTLHFLCNLGMTISFTYVLIKCASLSAD
jgi:hypothetical protein